MRWWDWERSLMSVERAVRALIGERPYRVQLEAGSGYCYVDFKSRIIGVDPIEVNLYGGKKLLPIQWIDSRGRDVPITNLASLQWVVAISGAYHEGGHVLFTQPYPIKGALHHTLAGWLEDQRMEMCTATFFPPARHAFRAYARMHALWVPLPDKATRSSTDVLLGACLFYRFAKQFPGSFDRYQFHTPEDELLWTSRICPLVEASWIALDSLKVGEIALEILNLLKIPAREGLGKHTLPAFPDVLKSPGERSPDDEVINLPVPVDMNAFMEGTMMDGEEGDETGGGSSDISDREESGGGLEESEAGTPSSPKGVPNTDPSHRPVPDELMPPGIDIEVLWDVWPRPYRDLARRIKGQKNRLRKVLKVPTPNTSYRPAKMGGRYWMAGEQRTRGRYSFRKRRAKGRARKGLAMVWLVDRTGSMGGAPEEMNIETGEVDEEFENRGERMVYAREATMLLEEVCPTSGIAICIGFAGNECICVHALDKAGNPRMRDERSRPVTWLRQWETPRWAEGPKALIAGMYGAGEQECLSLSLLEAQKKLDQRSEQTKLIIYVHDGLPTDESTDDARATVETLRRTKGTIILGVYVGPEDQFERLQEIFGKEWTILVDKLPTLIDRVGRILTKYARH